MASVNATISDPVSSPALSSIGATVCATVVCAITILGLSLAIYCLAPRHFGRDSRRRRHLQRQQHHQSKRESKELKLKRIDFVQKHLPVRPCSAEDVCGDTACTPENEDTAHDDNDDKDDCERVSPPVPSSMLNESTTALPPTTRTTTTTTTGETTGTTTTTKTGSKSPMHSASCSNKLDQHNSTSLPLDVECGVDEEDDLNAAVTCAICLTAFQVGQLICNSNNSSCRHKFHKECIQQWLRTHEECPVCREVYLLEETL